MQDPSAICVWSPGPHTPSTLCCLSPLISFLYITFLTSKSGSFLPGGGHSLIRDDREDVVKYQSIQGSKFLLELLWSCSWRRGRALAWSPSHPPAELRGKRNLDEIHVPAVT